MKTEVVFHWDGESMVPLDRFRHTCDEQYVIGEKYLLDAVECRSLASHNHYFAALNELWSNLPEKIDFMFPTAEHLRKHCLIMTGYRDERSFVAASKAEATRLAAFIKPIDDYAIVSVHENTVMVWTAKSQSYRAMGKVDFQKSKTDVLDYANSLIFGDGGK